MLERFDETDCKCGLPVTVEASPEGDLVRYADAQATIADLQGQLEVAQNKQTALEKSVRNLTEFYDKYNGTPCEQIRHQQEVELLQQRVAQLEGERADWKKAADDEPSAIYLGQLKAAKAALTPQAGKGGANGRVNNLSSLQTRG